MKRFATALALIPVITYIVIWSPFPAFAVVLTTVAVLCFVEYSGIVAAHGVSKPGPVGYIAGLIVLLAPHADVAIMGGVAVAAMSLALRANDLRAELGRCGALMLGVAYVFGCWRCAIGLRALSPYWLFIAIALNWVGDSAAYFAGRSLGRHRLAPLISPAKTWEGAVASTAGSVLFGVLFTHFAMPGTPVWMILVVCMLGNAAGQVGDLCESALKRGARMKDSGTMLPGHGGWLDRVDSTMFAVPVAYGLVASFRAWGIE
jgi:phosphatidate cytidylyltransferase